MTKFYCYPDGKLTQDVGNGETPVAIPARFGNRCFAAALALSDGPDDTVYVRGDLSGIAYATTIGSTKDSVGVKVGWSEGDVGCQIVGEQYDGEDPTIGPVSVFSQVARENSIIASDLTIWTEVNHGILFGAGQQHGVCELRRVNWIGNVKWPVRAHGQLRHLGMRECACMSSREWGLAYWDNIQGGVEILDCVASDALNGAIQGVNRMESGPSSFGDIIVARNRFTNCGVAGAASITIAGHLGGTVYIHANDIESQYANHAAVRVWGEGPVPSKGKLGAYTEGGYAVEEVVFGPRNKFTMADEKVNVGACRSVTLSPNRYGGSSGDPDVRISSSKVAGSQPVPEEVRFHGRGAPSTWAGWSGATKVEYADKHLSDAALDDLAVGVY